MKTNDQSDLFSAFTLLNDSLNQGIPKPNIFITSYNGSDELKTRNFEELVLILKEIFEVQVSEISPEECGFSFCKNIPTDSIFTCLKIYSKKIEAIRDILKEYFWPVNTDNANSPTLNTLMTRSHDIVARNFELSEFGVFIPYRTQKYSSLRTHSFHHKPVFYRFRLATDKIRNIPENIQSYLNLLFTDCPNHLFQKTDFRASAQSSNNLNIETALIHNRESKLNILAEESTSFNEFKSRHENLQKYFLLNDPETVACEVPLWIEANELEDYFEIFHTKDTLTGHIDILRYEKDGKIGIYDYKPNAVLELNASLQVSLYALMLSVRTGFCLKNILCCYFDETDIYFVDPRVVIKHLFHE